MSDSKQTKDNEILPHGTNWYELWEKCLPPLEQSESPANDELIKIRNKAKFFFQKHLDGYKGQSDNSLNFKMVEKTSQKGTFSDKVYALVMLVESDPIIRLESINELLSTCNAKGKGIIAVKALKDLFLSILPPERALVYFKDQPIASPGVTNNHLVAWYFEEQLKLRFTLFVNVIEEGLKQNIDNMKIQFMNVCLSLLMEKPEQERKLLNLLVNKLGDPAGPVAQSSITYLMTLLKKHPKMTESVATEVEGLIVKPTVPIKFRYFGIKFLNCISVASEFQGAINKLIEIYFKSFEILLKTIHNKQKNTFEDKGLLHSRLLRSILVGLNKTFPFAENFENFANYTNILFNIVKNYDFEKQALAFKLINMISFKTHLHFDRLCYEVYRVLFSYDIFIGDRVEDFLHTLFATLINDPEVERVVAIIKRLLIHTFYKNPNISASILLLIERVFIMRPALRKLVSQPETLSSEVTQNNKTALEFFESGNYNEKNPQFEKIKDMKLIDYDIGPKTPQPLKSKTSNSSFWEYYILSQSYHPHISKWATNTIQKQKQKYQGNPLYDFQMKEFLDRFCFKKPKKQNKVDPKKKRSYVSYAKRELPANVVMPSVPDEKIREEEKFFKTYFDLKKQTNPEKKVRKVKRDELENIDIEYDPNAVVDAGFSQMDFWKNNENDGNAAGSFLDDDGKLDYEDDGVEDIGVFDDNEGEWRGYEDMNNLDPDDLNDLAGSSDDDNDVFADADEFAEMLEDSDSEEKTKTKKRKRPIEKKNTKPRKKQRF